MIEFLVERAGSFAGDIDLVIDIITWSVFPWFFLAEGILFYFLFRYTRKKQPRAKYIGGDKKSQKNWITIPHFFILIFDVVIVAFAAKVWFEVKQDLPEADVKIRVVGQQWTWSFKHPGPDGILDTEDDIFTTDELHVEVDKTYHFELWSHDVLHNFSVPVFRLRQDTVPGRTITGWFKPTKTGEFDILCAEMCGIGHGIMGARIFIETEEEHEKWMETAPLTYPPLLEQSSNATPAVAETLKEENNHG